MVGDHNIHFVYEEDLGGGEWIRFTMIIDHQRSPYVLVGEAVLGGGYQYTTASINADTYVTGQEVYTNHHQGNNAYFEFMTDSMTFGAVQTLAAAEVIFEEDIPAVSVKDFGFKNFALQ